jgi:hypothetical protein
MMLQKYAGKDSMPLFVLLMMSKIKQTVSNILIINTIFEVLSASPLATGWYFFQKKPSERNAVSYL